MSKLYSDFELTEDNCDREPIHRPEAVQGGGHLLAFGAGRDAPLLALSADTATLLKVEEAHLWRAGYAALPASLRSAVEGYRQERNSEISGGEPYAADGQTFTLICHWHADVFFIELEQADDIDFPTASITRFAESARHVADLDALCELAATRLRASLAYDRVMVYQFDPDGHGLVIGEAKDEALTPFLGLHYPATDIPQNARDLFLLNRTRSIPGVHLHNRPIQFRAGHFGDGTYLDLSRCQLRATSPVHIQYLKNMGVEATFTIAIIVQGELWGLFACHHNSPKNPSLHARLRAEIFMLTFAHRVHEIEVRQQREFEQRSRRVEEAFIDSLRVEDQYQIRVLSSDAPLAQLCPCDGAAVVPGSNQVILRKGSLPPDNVILALRRWLVEQDNNHVYATDNLQDLPLEVASEEYASGGVLAVRVSEVSESFLFWFRDQQRQEVTWGGDPHNAGLTRREMDDGELRLSPRQSFQKWREQIDTRSLPWELWTLAMADRLRDRILRLELRHTAVLVARANREFMQLTFSAAHDLQEPLRTQLNYLSFLEEEFDDKELATIERFLRGSKGAVRRMQHLVNDLLSYAQLGREMTWENVDLNTLMAEIQAAMESSLKRANATLQIADLPTIVGDKQLLRQLLQNLISNGIKYVNPDVSPDIEVFVRDQATHFDLCVRDNGIGIREQDQERIFAMFTRLHHRSDYSGTGIGLAIAKRAAENLSGVINVESKEGQGSLFWCRFQKAQLVQ